VELCVRERYCAEARADAELSEGVLPLREKRFAFFPGYETSNFSGRITEWAGFLFGQFPDAGCRDRDSFKREYPDEYFMT
jgi:hypothetical protein